MKTIQLRALAVTLFTVLSVSFLSAQLQRDLMYWRPADQRGVDMFEDPKVDSTVFDGVRVRVGGAFAQQFQALSHENSAVGDEANLIELTNGFNLATANLVIGAQLADGVRLNLVTYLSSRHHPEAWVKGGYIQFDKMPFFNSEFVDNMMKVLRIKIGHMQINYGDQQFRRTDNGNALYNPFVGNYIMDAFNTEIGGEVYYMSNGIVAMVGITGGEIKGDVTKPPQDADGSEGKRAPTILLKLGYDNGANGKVADNVRFRVTGSMYYTASSRSNSLYSGDRGGSRYYLVTELEGASTSSNFTSGRYNPGFRDKVTSFQINPFVKWGGLEFFGTYEFAKGRASNETVDRSASQIAAELIYRFGKMEKVYLGARYNSVTSEDRNAAPVPGQDIGEISINRFSVAGGWFITRNILLKAEYVNQDYKDYFESSRFFEANFNGLMIEAVVGF